MEISSDVIYKLSGLSNKGAHVPVGPQPELVEKLIGTQIGKNSKGLTVCKIKATTPKMVSKIFSTCLSVIGLGCDLRLDMFQAVDTIEESGKTYCWDQYVAT